MKYFVKILLCFVIFFPAVAFADTTCETDSTFCSCDRSSNEVLDDNGAKIVSTSVCLDECTERSAERYDLICTSLSGTGVLLGGGTIAAAKPVVEIEITEASNALIPELIVDIPGVNFEESVGYDSEGNIQVNFLGTYIDGVYRFLIPAMSLVAVVMLMIAGLQYMLARGSADAIKKAKQRMSNAVVGLILLLASYNIAFIIDPNTLTYDGLTVRMLKLKELRADSGDLPGATAEINPTTVPTSIKCDSSNTLYDIAMSTIGRVTFRYGAKYGQSPPWADNGKIDANGKLYGSYCPEGQVCLDCSGYVAFLVKCAGLPSAGESGGTSEIFSGSRSEVITSYTDTSVNGRALVPGDLLGWPQIQTNGKTTTWGHTVIYIGNGKTSEAHADRKPGVAVSVRPVSEFIRSYINDDDITMSVRRR